MGWLESLWFWFPFSSLLWAGGLLGIEPTLLQGDRAILTTENAPILGQIIPKTAFTPTKDNEFPSFNSQQLDRQLQLYSRYVAEFGSPDILIIGSSRALWGVDPVALQQSLVKRGYPNLKIYNFSVHGATAQVVDLILRRLLLPNQLPRLILWADGSRAFNSGRIDHTYRKILASKGYKLLATGKHPSQSQSNTLELGRICLDMPPTYLASLPLRSPLPQQAASIFSSKQTNNPLLCTQHLQLSIQASQIFPDVPALHSQEEILGFQPLAARFDPSVYFQRYPRISGAYDGDYRSFSLEGEQTTALRNVVKFAQTRQIPLVFVNLPLTHTYLDAIRSEYEQEFRAYMQDFANSRQLIFYDLSRTWLTRYDYFIDPSHLNRYGAAAVSNHLSYSLMPLAPNFR